MDPLPTESDNLRASWDRHPEDVLDSYLVATTEDPRINPQSALTRALIADTLWPGTFDALIDEDLAFTAALSWAVKELEHHTPRDDLLTRYENLLPAGTTVPDPVSLALTSPPPDAAEGDGHPFSESALSPYQNLWHHALHNTPPPPTPLSLVEPACGSANDYRYLHAFGFSRSLDYTGFDIASKNIANARRRFPQTRFELANAYHTPFADHQFDFLFVHDLFEHLSPDALELALAECTRITRRQAWLHFFNLTDIPDHIVKPVDHYHWNTLSLDSVTRSLNALGATGVEPVHIPTLLNEKCPHLPPYHNHEATTLLVTLE